jgi:hypothetical protein
MTGPMYLFLCAGVPLILIGGFWWSTVLIFLLRAKETTGKILSLETSRHRNASRTLAEFQTEDGKTIQFTTYTGRSLGIFEFFILIPILLVRYLYQKALGKVTVETYDGDTVKILYDPNNPNRAHINNFNYLHSRPLALIMLGALISIGAIPVVSNFYSKIGEFLEKYLSWL